MNQSPSNTAPNSLHKLLFIWAAFASAAATVFGVLALLLFLHHREPPATSPGRPLELASTLPSSSPSLPPRVYLDEGFIFGPEGEGFERINIACPRSVLMEALQRIDAEIRNLRHA